MGGDRINYVREANMKNTLFVSGVWRHLHGNSFEGKEKEAKKWRPKN
jgi:hypothetical protein